MLLDEIERDTRSHTAGLSDVSFRHDTHEAFVAFGVGREQHEMIDRRVFGFAGAFASSMTRNVDFATQDRANADLFAGFVKLDRTEHVAVIGQSYGTHAERFGFAGEVLDLEGTVEQRVL